MEKFATRRTPRNRLLIFARVPELGRVKTRLARDLGDEKTLAVYEAMLRDLLVSIGPSDDETEVEILWTGTSEVDGATLRRYFDGLSLSQQAGQTLGDRLAVAFTERIAFYHAEKIIAIGIDDPSLSREVVRCAFRLLDSCEWAIGPASDGGYYLIGCRAGAFTAEIFDDIAWGSDSVLATTVSRIRALGASMANLPLRNDIDRVDDLRAYSAVVTPGAHMGNVLREWGWVE
jgi:hypothetical protein